MLSILIPNFNFRADRLIQGLYGMAERAGIHFEILLGEDGSSEEIYNTHKKLLQFEKVKILRNEQPTGRAAIRNLLGRKASFEWLLFIDSDAALVPSFSLDAYLSQANEKKVVCGGTLYSQHKPKEKSQLLRWKYGRKNEEISASKRSKNPYASFSSFNFMIHKDIFNGIGFDDSLSEYGHEDTLFGYQLLKHGIQIVHIDNVMEHSGLDNNKEFLQKTRKGLENLQVIAEKYSSGPDLTGLVKLLSACLKIRGVGLSGMLSGCFHLTEKQLIRNLLGKRPSLKIFQLYKLGYFCSLSQPVENSYGNRKNSN